YFTATSGTATAGVDFQLLQSSVSIPVGGRDAFVAFDVFDDTLTEGDETFDLAITDAAGVEISRTHATGTIVDAESACLGPNLIVNGSGEDSLNGWSADLGPAWHVGNGYPTAKDGSYFFEPAFATTALLGQSVDLSAYGALIDQSAAAFLFEGWMFKNG